MNCSLISRRSVSLLSWLFVLMIASVPAVGAPSPEGKLRVLVITGGHGFPEQPFQHLFQSIPDVAPQFVTYPDAADMLNPALADQCDVVVFYDMWTKGITPEQQQAFVDLLEKGIGVVALHHTLAAHPNWPEYAKIIGGHYYTKDRTVDGNTLPKSGFKHGQTMPVKVADGNHPITRGLKDFVIHDETYCRYDTDPNARVLLTTDHEDSDPELAWVKTYGRSRVFYLQLGHDEQAYENPAYRELVARGIRWAAGRVADPDAPPINLFNGRDLTGWVAEGDADWTVQDGLLIGKQGAGNAPGDLLTQDSFDDFELTVTFRVEWPANTGVWFRYQEAKKSYQADVLEYKEPFALTGTLYCPGKLFLAINDNPDIVNREGWNTIVVRAVGDHLMVFLNGHKTADVRDDTSDHGRIGFQVHAGTQFAKMKVIVKEVQLRPL